MKNFKTRHPENSAEAAFSACASASNSTSATYNYSDNTVVISDTVLSVPVFVISVLQIINLIDGIIISIIIENLIIIRNIKNNNTTGNLRAAA